MPELSDKDFEEMKQELHKTEEQFKRGEISEREMTEHVIDLNNRLFKDVTEVDLRLAHSFVRDVVELLAHNCGVSCTYRSKIGERMGEYGSQWVIKFQHGKLDIDIEQYIKGFMNMFHEKLNFEIDIDSPNKFTMFINKKIFDPFIVEVDGKIQKVHPVDPEYCGISIEEQKGHAKFMIGDIARITNKWRREKR